MKLYAHVVDGAVRELVALAPDPETGTYPEPGEDIFTVAFAVGLVEVTGLSPQPGQGWTTADGGRSFAPPATPAVDLTAYAAAARYARETGGITVGTAPIATDRESQALITGAWAYVQMTPGASVQWKTAAGFVGIGADQVRAIAAAVAAHVQACFAAEARAVSGIAAGTVRTAADVDEILAAA